MERELARACAPRRVTTQQAAANLGTAPLLLDGRKGRDASQWGRSQAARERIENCPKFHLVAERHLETRSAHWASSNEVGAAARQVSLCAHPCNTLCAQREQRSC